MIISLPTELAPLRYHILRKIGYLLNILKLGFFSKEKWGFSKDLPMFYYENDTIIYSLKYFFNSVDEYGAYFNVLSKKYPDSEIFATILDYNLVNVQEILDNLLSYGINCFEIDLDLLFFKTSSLDELIRLYLKKSDKVMLKVNINSVKQLEYLRKYYGDVYYVDIIDVSTIFRDSAIIRLFRKTPSLIYRELLSSLKGLEFEKIILSPNVSYEQALKLGLTIRGIEPFYSIIVEGYDILKISPSKVAEKKIDLLPRIGSYSTLFIDHEKCTLCMRCIKTCPQQALKYSNHVINLEETLCNMCGLCIGICPENAIIPSNRISL